MRRCSLALFASALFLALGGRLVERGGIGTDEVVHSLLAIEMLQGVPYSSSAYMKWGMKDSYQGALKSFILYPSFKVFGISPETTRWTTLVLGASAVFFGTLLSMSLCGFASGAFIGLLLATDPSLILISCYDTGPAVLSLSLKFAGLLLLRRWWIGRPGGLGWIFGGGLCFGLALWDKSHFLWFLIALPAAAALFYRAEIKKRASARAVIAAIAGLMLGASPFIWFNVVNPFATFENPGHLGWSLGEHVGRLPGWIAERLPMLLRALTGSGIYGMVAENPPAIVAFTGMWLMILGAPLLLLAVRTRRWAATRASAFWLGLTALIYGAACVSPVPVKFHHFYVCYPFPLLAFGALLAPALAAIESERVRRFGLAALLSVPLALNAFVLRTFTVDIDANGGTTEFYSGIRGVARWLEAELDRDPGLVFRDDGAYLENSLAVLLPNKIRSNPPRRNRERIRPACARGEKGRTAIILRRTGEEKAWPGSRPHALASLGEPAASFTYSDGSAWMAAYRGFLCDAPGLARGTGPS